MKTNNTPYLCGGIFFVLLLQARKHRSKVRNHYNSGKDGLSVVEIMNSLIKVVTTTKEAPLYGSSFKKNANQYKTCQYDDGLYIQFKDAPIIDSFDKAIKKILMHSKQNVGVHKGLY